MPFANSGRTGNRFDSARALTPAAGCIFIILNTSGLNLPHAGRFLFGHGFSGSCREAVCLIILFLQSFGRTFGRKFSGSARPRDPRQFARRHSWLALTGAGLRFAWSQFAGAGGVFACQSCLESLYLLLSLESYYTNARGKATIHKEGV